MAQPTDNKVSLGCGTLILIALIVLLFGNSGGNSDLKREIRSLKNEIGSIGRKTSEVQSEVKNLQVQLQAQNETLRRMQDMLAKSSAPPQPPPSAPPAEPKVESE
jgi:uncharacterized protein YlxW (UPF0749 family)